jgi:hydroxymethylpyrimidine/phosphomethylpyrimidine kinase
VRAIHEVPAEVVAAQIDAVLEDIGADAAKTGMLSSARSSRPWPTGCGPTPFTPLVVDPVMVAKSGDALLRPKRFRRCSS